MVFFSFLTTGAREVTVIQAPTHLNKIDLYDHEADASAITRPQLRPNISYSHAETIERRHSSSADPSSFDALVHAADSGDLAVVASMMLARADPTRASNAGLCPLDTVHNVKAHALMCALAPHTSKWASDIFKLDEALEALPAELRDSYEQAMRKGT